MHPLCLHRLHLAVDRICDFQIQFSPSKSKISIPSWNGWVSCCICNTSKYNIYFYILSINHTHNVIALPCRLTGFIMLFVSAFYGIAVFTLASISVIAFQPDNHIAIVTMLIFLVIYSILYHIYAKKNQFFSVDEKFIFQVTPLPSRSFSYI